MTQTLIYTHPKDCPDHKTAAADRAKHAAAARLREARLLTRARARWYGADLRG